jgi:hypothetical protein
VEPAKNIAELARSDGIVTISRFFDSYGKEHRGAGKKRRDRDDQPLLRLLSRLGGSRRARPGERRSREQRPCTRR